MGCGGSKQDVVSGNTVSHRHGLRKKSLTNPTAKAPSTSPVPVDASGNPATPLPPAAVADVKDIRVNMDGRPAAEGKLLVHSPDRYFSTRKEEESAEAAAGGEYFSPRYVPDDEEGLAKALEDPGTPKASDCERSSAGGRAGEGGGQAVGGGAPLKQVMSEKRGGNVSVDLKEPILVEETKLEVTVIDKKNLTIGEIVSDSSSTQ